MPIKLKNQFLIICASSLLMLLPACGGGETTTTGDGGTSTGGSASEESADENPFNKFQTQFNTFKGQIDPSLNTLDQGKKINYQGFKEANTFLTEFQNLIEPLKKEPNLQGKTVQYLNEIKTVNGEIEFILKNFSEGINDKNKNIQEKLGISRDDQDGQITPGGLTSRIMKDYLNQRTERIKSLVELITITNSPKVDANPTKNGGTNGNTESKGNSTQEMSPYFPVFLALIMAVIIINAAISVIVLYQSKEIKKYIEDIGKNEGGNGTVPEVNQIKTTESSQNKVPSSIQQSLTSFSQLLDSVKDEDVKSFFNAFSTIAESLGKLDQLENLRDQLDKLIEKLEPLSKLSGFIESDKFLQILKQIISNKNNISNVQNNVHNLETQVTETNKNQNEIIKNLISSHNALETRVPKAQEENLKSSDVPTPPPTNSDYNSIPLPESLIEKYHQDPELFENHSRKVKQTQKQIYDQLGGKTTDLIFELESKNYSPYWICPCAQKKNAQSHEYFYWLFLAPNQEITEANYPTLRRFFLGKISHLWIGKKWKLKEPALLKTIPGETPQFKLVKQGKLMLDE